jgi:1-acyl-sn-glycerol-3-phosphate acyltransferase
MATAAPSGRGIVHLLWGAAAGVIVFLMTIGVAVLAILIAWLTRSMRGFDWLGPIWGRCLLKVCGVRVDVEGLEHVDRKRSYVIISNHLSNSDVWATFASLPLNLRFVAKKELTRLPFFGRALAMSEHVIIDRANPEEAVARINARVAAQGSAPFCIVFYAEGTRSPDGKLHAFKKGGVNLALRTGLPIIPLTISGTWKLLPKGAWLIRPGGRVKLVLAPPIETAGMSVERRDELNERVRNVVLSNFDASY